MSFTATVQQEGLVARAVRACPSGSPPSLTPQEVSRLFLNETSGVDGTLWKTKERMKSLVYVFASPTMSDLGALQPKDDRDISATAAWCRAVGEAEQRWLSQVPPP